MASGWRSSASSADSTGSCIIYSRQLASQQLHPAATSPKAAHGQLRSAPTASRKTHRRKLRLRLRHPPLLHPRLSHRPSHPLRRHLEAVATPATKPCSTLSACCSASAARCDSSGLPCVGHRRTSRVSRDYGVLEHERGPERNRRVCPGNLGPLVDQRQGFFLSRPVSFLVDW